MKYVMPWLRFFRVVNLPTVPGDALAGAALAMAFLPETFPVSLAVAASVSLLFLYMAGVADNDVAGADTDVNRPVPLGEISLLQARIASFVCWLLSLGIALFMSFPVAWHVVFSVLTLLIVAYNRLKIPLLMGLCRGLGVASGMCAVAKSAPLQVSVLAPLAIVVFGWTLYIASVTKLSEGEESSSNGLGVSRYFLGLSALVPALSVFFAAVPGDFVLPVAGCVFTCIVWMLIVFPLGNGHSSLVRMRSVGKTIGALLYMQVGFMFLGNSATLVAAACVLWLSARFARRLLPGISGS
jgi:4-hydroxybenzoate polyprenyltransferase